MEVLLGLDRVLGNLGSGENGSGSSSRGGVTCEICACLGTKFGLGDCSGSLSQLSSSEGGSGLRLGTSEWCNGLGEILKESTGTREILAGSLLLGLGGCLPSLSSCLGLGGGGQGSYLLRGGGFSLASNGQVPGDVLSSLVGVGSNVVSLGGQGSEGPDRVPEVDLGGGSCCHLV